MARPRHEENHDPITMFIDQYSHHQLTMSRSWLDMGMNPTSASHDREQFSGLCGVDPQMVNILLKTFEQIRARINYCENTDNNPLTSVFEIILRNKVDRYRSKLAHYARMLWEMRCEFLNHQATLSIKEEASFAAGAPFEPTMMDMDVSDENIRTPLSVTASPYSSTMAMFRGLSISPDDYAVVSPSEQLEVVARICDYLLRHTRSLYQAYPHRPTDRTFSPTFYDLSPPSAAYGQSLVELCKQMTLDIYAASKRNAAFDVISYLQRIQDVPALQNAFTVYTEKLTDYCLERKLDKEMFARFKAYCHADLAAKARVRDGDVAEFVPWFDFSDISPRAHQFGQRLTRACQEVRLAVDRKLSGYEPHSWEEITADLVAFPRFQQALIKYATKCTAPYAEEDAPDLKRRRFR